jgi:hypothetical protein
MVAAKGIVLARSTDPTGQEVPGGSDLSLRRVLDGAQPAR